MKKFLTNKVINISIICILLIIFFCFNLKNTLFEKYFKYEFYQNYRIINCGECNNSLKDKKPVCLSSSDGTENEQQCQVSYSVMPRKHNLNLFRYFMKIKNVFI